MQRKAKVYNAKTKQNESPGKLWYARKKAAAVIAATRDKQVQGDAKGVVINSGVCAAATMATVSFFWIPFVPFITGAVAVVSGYRATRRFKDVRDTPAIKRHITKAEEKWMSDKRKAFSDARARERTLAAPEAARTLAAPRPLFNAAQKNPEKNTEKKPGGLFGLFKKKGRKPE